MRQGGDRLALHPAGMVRNFVKLGGGGAALVSCYIRQAR
jgi:hypothetical protein